MEQFKLDYVLLTQKHSSDGELEPALLRLYADGDYLAVLNSAEVARVLQLHSEHVWSAWSTDTIECEIGVTDSSDNWWLLVAAAASLSLFVQLNWTGPVASHTTDQPFSFAIDADSRKRCFQSLSLDGEEVYEQLARPELLFIARLVFHQWHHRLSAYPCALLWRLRYCLVHQSVLDECCQSLLATLQACLSDAGSDHFQKLLTFSVQIRVEWHLTVASVFHQFHYVSEARGALEAARDAVKLQLSFVGAMGKRTYWQDSKAQLALDVRVEEDTDIVTATVAAAAAGSDVTQSAETCAAGSDVTQSAETCAAALPPDVVLSDNTRRAKIEYDTFCPAQLDALQQSVVLNQCVLESKSEGRSPLRDEQLTVMLNTILGSPRNWCIQASALFQRCQLECDSGRTVERALQQSESLAGCVTSDQPPPQWRLRLFYVSHLPTYYQLQRALAQQLVSLGVVKSALDIFERLQLWDDAIKCYHHLQQRQRAEQLVRRLIAESGETPRLLCLLGDATDSVECYQRAWQLSDCTSVRAIRSHGLYYYFRNQYDVCIPLLQRCLQLNSLQFGVWLRLAYAALQQEDWPVCSAAYRRCCQLEPDNFEAWNNIARAYVHLGQKERAWHALREALKLNYDSWHIWHNFLLTSVDIGEFKEAITAYSRVSELKEKHVDVPILQALVTAAVDNVPDRHGVPSSRLRHQLSRLLHRLTDTASFNWQLWCLRGDLMAANTTTGDVTTKSDDIIPTTACDDVATAATAAADLSVVCYQRALRCAVLQPHWHHTVASCTDTLTVCRKLAQAVIKCASSCQLNDAKLLSTLMSVKMSLASTISKVKSSVDVCAVDEDGGGDASSDDKSALCQLLDTCQRLVDKIADAIAVQRHTN